MLHSRFDLSDNYGKGVSIRLEDVSYRYRNGPWVLQNVGFSVAAKDCVALLGRSGSGKSTLLSLVGGLLRPTRGALHAGERLVCGPSPRINLMFQRPSLFPWMSVAKNAGLGLRFGRRIWSRMRVREQVLISRTLALVGLEDRLESNVQELSGGQQQRVALARSLVMEPEALLLDEPFSALDLITRQELRKDVVRIVRASGITLLLVSHDVDEALEMSDRVLVLSTEGRLIGEFDSSSPVARQEIVKLLELSPQPKSHTVDGEWSAYPVPRAPDVLRTAGGCC